MDTDTTPQGLGVYRAVNAVQKALSITGIAKDRKNIQQGYQFRGIDEVYNELCGLLAEHHLCIFPKVLGREQVERQTKAGGVMFYTTCDVELKFVCSDDGSFEIVKLFGEAMDSGDKSTNKSMSAAYKYACLEVFCIPTKGDNDADATTHEIARSREAGGRNQKETTKERNARIKAEREAAAAKANGQAAPGTTSQADLQSQADETFGPRETVFEKAKVAWLKVVAANQCEAKRSVFQAELGKRLDQKEITQAEYDAMMALIFDGTMPDDEPARGSQEDRAIRAYVATGQFDEAASALDSAIASGAIRGEKSTALSQLIEQGRKNAEKGGFVGAQT